MYLYKKNLPQFFALIFHRTHQALCEAQLLQQFSLPAVLALQQSANRPLWTLIGLKHLNGQH